VGVIGAGGNTKLRHIPNLQDIPGVRITTVCNRTLNSSRAVAAEFGIAHATDNWREVVEDQDIDAIVIGTWCAVHG
jgi:predicted dehydrogenase